MSDGIPVEEKKVNNEIEIIEDENFSYEGYQVVRGEFFAHQREPGITFNNCKVSLNTACIRRLPEVEYVQFMVNPQTKILAVRPCGEEDKDSLLWCGENRKGRRVPKYITCKIFYAKITELMGWNPEHRYKIIGKIIQSDDEILIIFDLKATEVYQRLVRNGTSTKTSRIPQYPAEWKDQFGLPIEEHKKLLQVNIFDNYTVFEVKSSRRSRQVNKEMQTESGLN